MITIRSGGSQGSGITDPNRTLFIAYPRGAAVSSLPHAREMPPSFALPLRRTCRQDLRLRECDGDWRQKTPEIACLFNIQQPTLKSNVQVLVSRTCFGREDLLRVLHATLCGFPFESIEFLPWLLDIPCWILVVGR